ncbi:MAG: aspartyl-trna synthetase [Rhodobacterales bacterium]|nr:MAG: aspartyl-trna synthetase [Rhodobacterales bacterium]
MSIFPSRMAIALLAALFATAAPAQDTQPAAVPPAIAATRGQITNLPLPRFVSMRAEEGNARRGPSLSHRIDWVFKRRNIPLIVTAEHGHWRRVEDIDGQGGWMHYSLLSGVRTAIVEQDVILRAQPALNAQGVAQFQAGVIAQLLECTPDWCRLRASRQRGWVPKEVIWGVRADEVFE